MNVTGAATQAVSGMNRFSNAVKIAANVGFVFQHISSML
jgi:hypothetical protein